MPDATLTDLMRSHAEWVIGLWTAGALTAMVAVIRSMFREEESVDARAPELDADDWQWPERIVSLRAENR